jgi:hypothetical protein
MVEEALGELQARAQPSHPGGYSLRACIAFWTVLSVLAWSVILLPVLVVFG